MMPELSAPLRVTWDLSADPSLAEGLWGRLREGRVLFAEVVAREETLASLPRLVPGAGGPRLSIVVPLGLASAAVDALGAGRLRAPELIVLPPYTEPSSERADLRGASAALWSTPEGLVELPAALALAEARELGAVVVLNPPAPARPLGAADRARAAGAWLASGLSDRVSLRCHDLFLAEALGLEPFLRYAGCQAAGQLAHLDRQGRLLACRTLPVELGDLTVSPLSELWAGPRRRELRAKLHKAPGPCAGCSLEAVCRGGCRGLAADLRARDSSCPGARSRTPGAG